MLPATSVAIAPIISASATGWRLKSRNAKRKPGGGDEVGRDGSHATRASAARARRHPPRAECLHRVGERFTPLARGRPAPPAGGLAVVARTAGDAWGRATALVCDALLAFCVLGLAAWTVAYHACLVLGLGAGWALPRSRRRSCRAACSPPARAPSGAPAPDVGGRRARAGAPPPSPVRGGRRRGRARVRRWPWPATWALWAAAAGAAVLASGARTAPAGRVLAPGAAPRSRGRPRSRCCRCSWSARPRRRLLPAAGDVDRRARPLPARRHAALPRRAARPVLPAAALLRGAVGTVAAVAGRARGGARLPRRRPGRERAGCSRCGGCCGPGRSAPPGRR